MTYASRERDILDDIPYMWNLKRNNTSELTKQRLIEETYGCLYTLLYLKWITKRSYCIAWRTLLNVLWQPGWEGSLEENGYMYIYS